MSEKFKVKVNSSFDFDISESEISNLDALQVSKNNFHILQESKSYKAEIVASNFNSKSYQIKINNNTYVVDIMDDLDLLIKKMGLGSKSSKLVDSIKAPMPGLILEMHVEVDQEVKENDSLFILEAMKMENSILSPRDGVIKSISAKKGDAVEKNQLLIEFEN
ncbi:acetyl-CoA carboxylase biotin carboxyl carrier protein subunit [Flavobacteriaceae bacterium SZ-1-7]|uniref:acetyl-CoA carboxylase biotin carboxyl carrier protein subunit n=1 Tax=Tamlana sedimenti TaxID=3134126 RepID=UPI003120B4CE